MKADIFKTSTANKFISNFKHGSRTEVNFCFVTLKNKIKAAANSVKPWGGDDTMYYFSDGSMLLERKIVKEFQLFKGR